MVEVLDVPDNGSAVSSVHSCHAAKFVDLQSKAAAAVTRRLQTGTSRDFRADIQSAMDATVDWGPASPRRPLRSLVTPRGEREAVRQQRRLEIERELREKLGLDEVSDKPAEPVESDCMASSNATGSTSTAAAAGPSGGTSERPPSRPSSSRRGASGVAGGSLGPSRPPKPKPYRPLHLSEESSNTGSGSPSAQALPQDRRWRSALLPVWPDRQPSQAEYNAEIGLDLAKTAPAAVLVATILSDALPRSHVGTSSYESSPVLPSSSGGALPSGHAGNTSPSANAICHTVPDATDATGGAACTRRNSSPKGSRSETQLPREEGSTSGADAAPAAVIGATALAMARCMEEQAQVLERTRQLEEGAQRLRENAARICLENRRWRVHDPGTTSVPAQASLPVPLQQSSATHCSGCDNTAACYEVLPASDPLTPQQSVASQPPETSRRIEEMRRKIAELDEVNELERSRLEQEQRELQERRRMQEEFERHVQERTERDIQEHREREAREEEERVQREEEERRERRQRNRRRQEQLNQEQEYSRRLEVTRREGRSESQQMKWQLFEEELDRQWAEQEAEERRRVEDYAKERRKAYEEWDRRLTSERQRFASEAEFCEAARHRKARSAAHADEQFYGPRRCRNVGPTADGGSSSSSLPSRPPWPPPRPPPPNAAGSSSCSSGATSASMDMKSLLPEERAVLKELQSVRNACRDSQKAKVKELLFRWHPDKNPTCVEKATQVFQFVQRQRDVVLGL